MAASSLRFTTVGGSIGRSSRSYSASAWATGIQSACEASPVTAAAIASSGTAATKK